MWIIIISFNNHIYDIKYSLDSRADKEFRKVGSNKLVERLYNFGSNISINCCVIAYKNSKCLFIWNRQKNNHDTSIIQGLNLSDSNPTSSLIEGYNGNATLSSMLVFSYLYISK